MKWIKKNKENIMAGIGILAWVGSLMLALLSVAGIVPEWLWIIPLAAMGLFYL